VQKLADCLNAIDVIQRPSSKHVQLMQKRRDLSLVQGRKQRRMWIDKAAANELGEGNTQQP
jgi:hypothetical protein